MEWSALTPLSEKGNHLPLVLLVIVKQPQSGVWGSPGPGKGMCCLWPFLPGVLSYSTATPESCTSCPASRWDLGTCPLETSVAQTRVELEQGRGMLQRARAVLEPEIKARGGTGCAGASLGQR